MAVIAALFLFAGVLLGMAQMGVWDTRENWVAQVERLTRKVEQIDQLPASTRQVLVQLRDQARGNCPPGKCARALALRNNAVIDRLSTVLEMPETTVAVNVSSDDVHATGTVK